MKSLIILSLALLMVFTMEEASESESAVVQAGENLEEIILNNEVVMLKVYSPSCGHCKRFAPVYEEFAQKAKNEGKNWVIAEIDGTAHRAAIKPFGITGFPTVMLFKTGSKSSTFDKSRTVENLMKWVESPAQPLFITLEAEEEIKKISQVKDKVSVFYFGTDLDMIKKFLTFSEASLQTLPFYVADPSLGQKVFPDLRSNGGVVLTKTKMKNETLIFPDEEITIDPLTKFIKDNMYGPYDLDPGKLMRIRFKSPVATLIRDGNLPNAEELDLLYDQFATQLNTSFFVYAIIDSNEEKTKKFISKDCELKNEDLPKFVIVQYIDGRTNKVAMNDSLTIENMITLAKDFQKGKYKLPPQGEPIPLFQDSIVYKLVTDNLEDFIFTPDTDIIIHYFHPKKKNTLEVEKKFKEYAKLLEPSSKLKFGQMDMSKNDYPFEKDNPGRFPNVRVYSAKSKASNRMPRLQQLTNATVLLDEELFLKEIKKRITYPIKTIKEEKKVKEDL